ncbi:hypothetical protein L917_03663 [Phytophthora nicotianae]|uniref:DUF6570 domain-containing protein n=1 Tax=Phytophthora nicotianae TaxID=4792 RepID=W2LS74_PHYNI|nr:hypothetical protein L917_03663 [Phytophthora nicotianae]
MLNLSQPMHFISVVRGGKHSSLRSHAYFFRADPAAPAQMLPRDVVSEGVIGVTMVGALTTAQKATTLKKYDVRVKRLREQLDWYKKNNELYRSVSEQPEWETSLTTIRTRVVIDQANDDRREETGPNNGGLNTQKTASTRSSSLVVSSDNEDTACASTAAATVILQPGEAGGHSDEHEQPGLAIINELGSDELDRSMWRHNAPVPAYQLVSEEDELREQIADGWISDFKSVDVPTGVQHALNKSRVTVYRSSGILSDFDPAFWTNSFSELFPYGRGGLDEVRNVPISLLEFIRYCLRLSSGRFAQHRSFPLVAFDVLARDNSMQAISIRARMLPGSMERSASVSREELKRYVQYQHDRMKAISEQLPPPPPPEVDRSIRELYSSISTGMRSYWGSNEERTAARADLLSMQLKLDNASTFRIANLAGFIPDDVLEEMETGVRECLDYTKAKLGQIATSNPYLCAR